MTEAVSLDNIGKALAKFGLTRETQNVSQGWTRVFMHDPEGVTLGRVMFRHGKYTHAKWYGYGGVHWSPQKLKDRDKTYLLVQHFLDTGEVLTDEDWESLKNEVKELSHKIFEENKAKRAALPLTKIKNGEEVPIKRRSLKFPDGLHMAGRILTERHVGS